MVNLAATSLSQLARLQPRLPLNCRSFLRSFRNETEKTLGKDPQCRRPSSQRHRKRKLSRWYDKRARNIAERRSPRLLCPVVDSLQGGPFLRPSPTNSTISVSGLSRIKTNFATSV